MRLTSVGVGSGIITTRSPNFLATSGYDRESSVADDGTCSGAQLYGRKSASYQSGWEKYRSIFTPRFRPALHNSPTTSRRKGVSIMLYARSQSSIAGPPLAVQFGRRRTRVL